MLPLSGILEGKKTFAMTLYRIPGPPGAFWSSRDNTGSIPDMCVDSGTPPAARKPTPAPPELLALIPGVQWMDTTGMQSRTRPENVPKMMQK